MMKKKNRKIEIHFHFHTCHDGRVTERKPEKRANEPEMELSVVKVDKWVDLIGMLDPDMLLDPEPSLPTSRTRKKGKGETGPQDHEIMQPKRKKNRVPNHKWSKPEHDPDLSPEALEYRMSNEYRNRDKRCVPNLQTENLNASFALVNWLIDNPSSRLIDVHRFINKQKECLRHHDRSMHYMNYQNIMRFLFNTDRVESIKTGRTLRYNAK